MSARAEGLQGIKPVPDRPGTRDGGEVDQPKQITLCVFERGTFGRQQLGRLPLHIGSRAHGGCGGYWEGLSKLGHQNPLSRFSVRVFVSPDKW